MSENHEGMDDAAEWATKHHKRLPCEYPERRPDDRSPIDFGKLRITIAVILGFWIGVVLVVRSCTG